MQYITDNKISKLWNNYKKKGNLVKNFYDRKSFIPKYIRCFHVIYFSDSLQFVIHKNLHMNPHYTFSKHSDMLVLEKFAEEFDIDIEQYGTKNNNYDICNGKSIVINNFKQKKEILDMINPFLVYKELQKAKLCKKRNVKGFYVGPSAANAKGWIAPRPDLDKYSSSANGKLNMEGYSNNVPSTLHNSLSNALNYMGTLTHKVLNEKCMRFAHDVTRNKMWSEQFEQNINSHKRIFFEGASMQANIGDLPIHMDVENCSQEGYNYSCILSLNVNGIRCAWIGFFCKRAYNYMLRLENCTLKSHENFDNIG